jgi:hypothetical protein
LVPLNRTVSDRYSRDSAGESAGSADESCQAVSRLRSGAHGARGSRRQDDQTDCLTPAGRREESASSVQPPAPLGRSTPTAATAQQSVVTRREAAAQSTVARHRTRVRRERSRGAGINVWPRVDCSLCARSFSFVVGLIVAVTVATAADARHRRHHGHYHLGP